MAGNTMEKASQSEAKFIVKAFECGWEVSKPFHHSQGYDYVIRRGKKWETVQVKTAYRGASCRGSKEARAINLRRCNEKGSRSYVEGEFDLLFAVDGDVFWLIPWSVLSNIKASILIDAKCYAQYKI